MSLQYNSLDGGGYIPNNWLPEWLPEWMKNDWCSGPAQKLAHLLLSCAIFYAVCVHKSWWTGIAFINTNVIKVLPKFLVLIFKSLLHEINGYFLQSEWGEFSNSVISFFAPSMTQKLTIAGILALGFWLSTSTTKGAIFYASLHSALCASLTGPLYLLGYSDSKGNLFDNQSDLQPYQENKKNKNKKNYKKK